MSELRVVNSPRERLGIAENLGVLSLSFAIGTFLSPQIGIVGRGLRTALPMLLISFLAITSSARFAFVQSLIRYKITFYFGLFFIFQAATRFLLMTTPSSNLWHAFVINPLLSLMFLLWIGAISELGAPAVARMRSQLLFIWGLSITLSLPTLIAHPGVARLTMGNPNEVANAAKWGPLGVAEYTNYTNIGICLGLLYQTGSRSNPSLRLISTLLIASMALAVFFSTFTMASTLVAIDLMAISLFWILKARGVPRLSRALTLISAMIFLPYAYSLSGNFEQTRFVTTKVERLTLNISEKGLSKGDETNRGAWFMEELKAFASQPFLGYIPDYSGETGHGHSSLSNSLVLFGLFGALTWVFALFWVLKSALANPMLQSDRIMLILAWLLFVFSGILNPIWHSFSTLAVLFAFSIPAKAPEPWMPSEAT